MTPASVVRRKTVEETIAQNCADLVRLTPLQAQQQFRAFFSWDRLLRDCPFDDPDLDSLRFVCPKYTIFPRNRRDYELSEHDEPFALRAALMVLGNMQRGDDPAPLCAAIARAHFPKHHGHLYDILDAARDRAYVLHCDAYFRGVCTRVLSNRDIRRLHRIVATLRATWLPTERLPFTERETHNALAKMLQGRDVYAVRDLCFIAVLLRHRHTCRSASSLQWRSLFDFYSQSLFTLLHYVSGIPPYCPYAPPTDGELETRWTTETFRHVPASEFVIPPLDVVLPWSGRSDLITKLEEPLMKLACKVLPKRNLGRMLESVVSDPYVVNAAVREYMVDMLIASMLGNYQGERRPTTSAHLAVRATLLHAGYHISCVAQSSYNDLFLTMLRDAPKRIRLLFGRHYAAIAMHSDPVRRHFSDMFDLRSMQRVASDAARTWYDGLFAFRTTLLRSRPNVEKGVDAILSIDHRVQCKCHQPFLKLAFTRGDHDFFEDVKSRVRSAPPVPYRHKECKDCKCHNSVMQTYVDEKQTVRLAAAVKRTWDMSDMPGLLQRLTRLSGGSWMDEMDITEAYDAYRRGVSIKKGMTRMAAKAPDAYRLLQTMSLQVHQHLRIRIVELPERYARGQMLAILSRFSGRLSLQPFILLVCPCCNLLAVRNNHVHEDPKTGALVVTPLFAGTEKPFPFCNYEDVMIDANYINEPYGNLYCERKITGGVHCPCGCNLAAPTDYCGMVPLKYINLFSRMAIINGRRYFICPNPECGRFAELVFPQCTFDPDYGYLCQYCSMLRTQAAAAVVEESLSGVDPSLLVCQVCGETAEDASALTVVKGKGWKIRCERKHLRAQTAYHLSAKWRLEKNDPPVCTGRVCTCNNMTSTCTGRMNAATAIAILKKPDAVSCLSQMNQAQRVRCEERRLSRIKGKHRTNTGAQKPP